MPGLAIGLLVAGLRGALKSLAGEFARHGYAILFGLVTAESFWFPVPGELSLLAAGYEASRGKLDVFWVAGAGTAAAIGGDNLAYLFGRLAGRPLITRVARLLRLHAGRADTMNHYFDRHAGMAIATARWISPLRGLVAVSAGAARVPWRRFAISNAVGSVTWASTVTALAYGLSRSLGELAEIFSVTGVVAVVAVFVAAVAIFLWRLRRKRKAGALFVTAASHADAPPAGPGEGGSADEGACADQRADEGSGGEGLAGDDGPASETRPAPADGPSAVPAEKSRLP